MIVNHYDMHDNDLYNSLNIINGNTSEIIEFDEKQSIPKL